MSMPTLAPALLEAAVPGTPVWRENVLPPSWVASTEPLRSSRKPTCGETKLNACTWSEQPASATVKIRVNTTPPSVDTRRMQPLALPITTVAASMIWTRVSSPDVPVASPVHVAPPSSVFSAVPLSPTA